MAPERAHDDHREAWHELTRNDGLAAFGRMAMKSTDRHGVQPETRPHGKQRLHRGHGAEAQSREPQADRRVQPDEDAEAQRVHEQQARVHPRRATYPFADRTTAQPRQKRHQSQ